MKLKTYRADEWTGDSQIYDPKEVDTALAAKNHDIALLRDRIGELIGEREDYYESGLEKDRDLADANHMLLAANASADALKRVAEQRQAVIERLQRALNWLKSQAELCYVEVPAEFADIIIKPTAGASNG